MSRFGPLSFANSKAYETASQALQNEEELTFTEQEIDQLLPDKQSTNEESDEVKAIS